MILPEFIKHEDKGVHCQHDHKQRRGKCKRCQIKADSSNRRNNLHQTTCISIRTRGMIPWCLGVDRIQWNNHKPSTRGVPRGSSTSSWGASSSLLLGNDAAAAAIDSILYLGCSCVCRGPILCVLCTLPRHCCGAGPWRNTKDRVKLRVERDAVSIIPLFSSAFKYSAV